MTSDSQRLRERDATRISAFRTTFNSHLTEAGRLLSLARRYATDLLDLERDNAALVIGGVSVMMMAALIPLWIPGVYIIDATILRPTSVFVLGLFSPESARWREIAIALLPVGFVGVDIVTSMALRRTSGVSHVFLLMVAIAWTLAMPAFAYAAYVAGAGAPESNDAIAQVTGLCIVAFGAHGSLVFGGGVLEDGVQALFFLVSRWWKQRALASYCDALIKRVGEGESAFDAVKQATRIYNRDYVPDSIEVPAVPELLTYFRDISERIARGEPIPELPTPPPIKDGADRPKAAPEAA